MIEAFNSYFYGLHYQPRTFIQVVCTAYVVALVLTPLTGYVLRRVGMLDHVKEGKLHERPVPRGGGIAIFIAFAVAVLLPNYRDDAMKGVLIGAFVCLLVGMVDDVRGVPASIKLLTLVAVTLVMSRFGVRLNLFRSAPILDYAVTLLWIVGVTSAFNGMDNMDGLASGLAAIVSAMYLVIALQAFLMVGTETSLSWFGLLAAGLFGANLGFLVFNSKPAKIFMGDSGSFFLGFTLAALGVMGEWAENRLISCSIPVIILGVPIFDFAYILVARIVRGDTRNLRSVIEHCGLDHLSHRLMWMGFSQRQAVLFIYLVALCMGVSGILLRNSHSFVDTALALFQGLSIAVIVMILMGAVTNRHLCMLREEAERLKRRFRRQDEAASSVTPAPEPEPATVDSADE